MKIPDDPSQPGAPAAVPPPEASSTTLDTAQWVDWHVELITSAQTGLTYARDAYDVARYTRIREIALAMLAAGAQQPLATVRALFEVETGHATPKVDVRAAVLREGRVLLCASASTAIGHSRGAGRMSAKKRPREAVEREVREESGYTVRDAPAGAVRQAPARASAAAVLRVQAVFRLRARERHTERERRDRRSGVLCDRRPAAARSTA